MSIGQLIAVRANESFDFNTAQLIPRVEIILLVEHPKYVSCKNGKEYKKESDIKELRFTTGINGVNELLASLQIAKDRMVILEEIAKDANKDITVLKKEG